MGSVPFCDRCGGICCKNQSYTLRMDFQQAYDELEITEEDLKKDSRKEFAKILREIEDWTQEEMEEDIFVRFEFNLCRKCRNEIVRRLKKTSLPR